MAASTKALPRMDISISGALRTQFMMTIVPGVELYVFMVELMVFRSDRTDGVSIVGVVGIIHHKFLSEFKLLLFS